jgi:RNA polymerase-binding transcription factor DksA
MRAVATTRTHVSPGRGGRRTELVRCLPRLRAALERERAFRVEQLSSMAVTRPARRDGARTPADIARAQVDEQVAAGAGRALADIEFALKAIRTGRYGRCAGCDEEIAVEVLLAVPQTRLCLTCHSYRAERRRVSSGHGV